MPDNQSDKPTDDQVIADMVQQSNQFGELLDSIRKIDLQIDAAVGKLEALFPQFQKHYSAVQASTAEVGELGARIAVLYGEVSKLRAQRLDLVTSIEDVTKDMPQAVVVV